MKKKFIAVAFLALVLVAGTLPATAFAGTGTLVTNVTISITEPAVGNTADRNPTIVSTPEVNPTVETIAWGVTSEEDYDPDDITSSNWSRLGESDTFTAGKYYALVLSLKTTEEFSTDVTVTCNGQNPVKKEVAATSSGSELQLYFAFHVTESLHTHTYSDVWGYDASQHWHECTDAACPDKTGSVKDLANHTFQWVVDREATTSEAGIKHEACTVCGYTQSANTEIAKLASSSTTSASEESATATGIPATGDTSSAFALAVLFISAVSVCVVAMRPRKKNAPKHASK